MSETRSCPTFGEAVLQGFLELVEGDAFACWWYSRLVLPEIELESFDVRPRSPSDSGAVQFSIRMGLELLLRGGKCESPPGRSASRCSIASAKQLTPMR
jgi:hypothetical protein